MNYSINIGFFFIKKVKDFLFFNNTLLKNKLILSGLGYKSWVIQKNKCNYIVLRIGFSFDVSLLLFSTIQIICLKYNLILTKSLNKEQLNSFSAKIRRLRKNDRYKTKVFFMIILM